MNKEAAANHMLLFMLPSRKIRSYVNARPHAASVNPALLPNQKIEKVAEHLIGRAAVCELVVRKTENALGHWR